MSRSTNTRYVRVWLICLIGLHSFRMFLLFIGPLKRLHWAFDNLKAGDLTVKVVLRDGDFLIEEGDSLNATIETLGAKLHKARAAAEASRSALNDLHDEIQVLPPDIRSQLTGGLQALKGSLADEQRCLDYFKTPEEPIDADEPAH